MPAVLRAPRPLPRVDEARRRALPPDRVLPPAGWLGTWFPHDKHAVVAAVRAGQVTLGRVMSDYMLGLDEFAEWYEEHRDGPEMSPMMVEYRVLLNEMHPWLTRGG